MMVTPQCVYNIGNYPQTCLAYHYIPTYKYYTVSVVTVKGMRQKLFH